MISGGVFDIVDKKQKIRELDKEITRENFWNNPNTARKITRERAHLVKITEMWDGFDSQIGDQVTLMELSREDEELYREVDASLSEFTREFERYEFETMFSQKHDLSNAIVAIHPGAGGTESQDWAQILLRMYTRWAERRGFKLDMLDFQPGDEAGIKSATFQVLGEYAYGYLKAEVGVHRLVRISPFDANSRRHTSFASIFVYPEIEDDVDIEINLAEVRVDVYRASGPGGQGVNTTDSAVRLTHIPSGIVITCQNERSQHRNRDIAMKILRARLYDLKLKEMDEEKRKVEDGKKEIAWGSQIRSYVLHPYRMIKDHRSDVETGNVDDFLDGNIDAFMEAFLRTGKY